MSLLSGLLADSAYLFHYLGGLAFFAMGLAVLLETRRSSEVKLVDSLWLLCAYAFAAASAKALQMFSLLDWPAGQAISVQTLQAGRALLVPIAALFLLQFGVRVVISASPQRRRLRWLPWALSLLAALAFVPATSLAARIGARWWEAAEVAGRAVLYFPALLLAAAGLALQGRAFLQMKLHRVASDCTWAAGAFALKALISGLLPLPAPDPSSPWWGIGLLAQGIGLPTQILRVATTVAIAVFVVRALRFMEAERRRQLSVACEQRLQAQQEALEAQQRTREAVEHWSGQLEDMVNTVAAAVSQPLDLKEMLDTALRKALDLTGFQAGGILLAQGSDSAPALMASSGLPEAAGGCPVRMMLGGEATEAVRGPGDALVVRRAGKRDGQEGGQASGGAFRLLVSVPVRSRHHTLGIMNLLSRNERAVGAQELAVLAAIGQQIAVGIENARLYGEAQNMAALEERGRLSRELHDGLAQVLGYLSLKSDEAKALLASGQDAEASGVLDEMRDVAREAYQDVRETLLGLRTTLSPDRTLFATLSEYVRRFGEQSGVRVSLAVDDGAGIEFAPDVEIQLLRIIQEALTNVRKHARAKRAWVRFELEGEQARITIRDDGRGFDARTATGDGVVQLGLQTMSERAQSVGGSVRVESEPGKGTRVVVRIPVGNAGGERT